MIELQRFELAGQRFVLLPESEFDRLCAQAGEATAPANDNLPPLPKPDKHGRYPAVEYARVTLARRIIGKRQAVGLSQRELAELSGLRQETISRLESGKQTATPRTVDKIMDVLESQQRRRRRQ
jgi:ribosome-binding protein aMBF1 (putative translation factor)